MFENFGLLITLLWFLARNCGLSYGLQIQQLTVPRAVKANSTEVILDCKYKVEEWERNNGFVLKWYINSVSLVYQWIPPRPPTILGSLRGRLDTSYRASQDPWEEHRALRIINPDPSLTGRYSCAVTSFEGEDVDSAELLIWAPPSDVRLRYWRPSAYLVNVTCSALEVSPQPIFKLYISAPNGTRQAIGIMGRSDFSSSSLGLYDSHSWGLVVYETTKEDSVIGCSVLAKGNMFKETRETVYHADIPIITTTTTTTTTRPDEEAIKSPSIASLAISSQRPHKAIGFKMTFLLFIAFLSCRRLRNIDGLALTFILLGSLLLCN